MKYIIYKIVHKFNKNNFYVGSTNNLKRRILEHKRKCKKPKCKIHRFITENGGFNNFYFYIIDIIECEEGQQFITEDKYIRQLNPPLNTIKAIEDKEQVKEYNKQYYQANKQKNKQYYQANKEKLKEYKKQYRQANKEKIKEQNKLYRQRKKQELLLIS